MTRVSGKRNIWRDTWKLNIVEYDRISVPIAENALGRRRIYRNTKWHTLERSPFNALSAKSVLEVRQIWTGTSDVTLGRNHIIVLIVVKILDRQVILAGMSKNIQTNDYFFKENWPIEWSWAFIINLQEKSTRNEIRPQICQVSMDKILLSATLLDSSALFQLYETHERRLSFNDFLRSHCTIDAESATLRKFL